MLCCLRAYKNSKCTGAIPLAQTSPLVAPRCVKKNSGRPIAHADGRHQGHTFLSNEKASSGPSICACRAPIPSAASSRHLVHWSISLRWDEKHGWGLAVAGLSGLARSDAGHWPAQHLSDQPLAPFRPQICSGSACRASGRRGSRSLRGLLRCLQETSNGEPQDGVIG